MGECRLLNSGLNIFDGSGGQGIVPKDAICKFPFTYQDKVWDICAPLGNTGKTICPYYVPGPGAEPEDYVVLGEGAGANWGFCGTRDNSQWCLNGLGCGGGEWL